VLKKCAGEGLTEDATAWRRARTPRFKRLLWELDRERGRKRAEPPSTVAKAVLTGADAATDAAVRAQTGGASPVKPSAVLTSLRSPVAWVWRRVSPLPSAQWARTELRALDEGPVPATAVGAKADALSRALGHAMAEDLRAMHTRKHWLKVGRCVVFVDAYQRIEEQREGHPRFLVDFAERLRKLRVPVVLVVACRRQERWTRLLERSAAVREWSDVYRASDAVEIHTLYPVPPDERVYVLARLGVPSQVAPQLAAASKGVPLAIVSKDEAREDRSHDERRRRHDARAVAEAARARLRDMLRAR
jgi:hypothetical protein